MKIKLALLAMAAPLFFTTPSLAENTTDDLYRACVNGDVQSLKSIYADMKPGDLDQEIKPGYWPLHYAVANGHFQMVVFLINHGADYAKRTSCGISLWQLAASLVAKSKGEIKKAYKKIAQFLAQEGKMPPASPRHNIRPELRRSFSDRRA